MPFPAYPMLNPAVPREAILAALRAAAQVARARRRPLTFRLYAELRRTRSAGAWPHPKTVVTHFGTWSRAVAAAGAAV